MINSAKSPYEKNARKTRGTINKNKKVLNKLGEQDCNLQKVSKAICGNAKGRTKFRGVHAS